MKVGDHAPVDPSEFPRKFREVFVLRPVESAEGMQPKVSKMSQHQGIRADKQYAIQSANFRFIG